MKQFIKTTILLLAILLPAIATAHDFAVDGIFYNINGNEAEVTNYQSDYFPYRYTGTVTIPATVTYNGTTYPVTAIGDNAFAYCSGLTSVTIPNSVTAIGQGAFISCPRLTSIVVESGNPRYDSRNNCNAIIETATNTLIVGCKNTIIPNSVTEIGDGAFEGCTGQTSIDIPNSVTAIGDGAFGGCTGLTSIDIPNSVTAIGAGAFSGCTGLTSIDIPNSVTAIGDKAFHSCSGLTSIDIPNSVTSIGEYTFYGCKFLTSIVIPNSVTSIGYSAFASTGLTSVTIPNSVTTIDENAFHGCSGLRDVYCYIADLSRVSIATSFSSWTSLDYSGRTLHVLQGTADAYRADENWYPYFEQIVEDIFLGDVNRDLEVNISDVNAAIDMILCGNDGTPSADVNGDGEINIADINAVIDIILSGTMN